MRTETFLASGSSRRSNFMLSHRTLISLATGLAPAIGVARSGDDDRAARQAELGAACEAARDAKLAPIRAQYVEECAAREQRPDRASCQRYYADYGNRSGNQAPLFYDLPECVAAQNFRLGKE
jgi:hypothetical protein